MSRIAPPALVVTDGGSGFARACKKVWPATRVQRCTFHAYCRIRQATTTRPKLEASRSLYALGRQLTHVQDIDGAQEWIGAYQAWCTRWKGFLEEKTRRPDGGWEYTHERLVRARNSLNKLISQGLLFTYLDPTGTPISFIPDGELAANSHSVTSRKHALALRSSIASSSVRTSEYSSVR